MVKAVGRPTALTRPARAKLEPKIKREEKSLLEKQDQSQS